MAAMHLDVHRLDYDRLGMLAHRIANALGANMFRRFSKASVKRLIREALEQGRIDPAALPAKMLGEVASAP